MAEDKETKLDKLKKEYSALEKKYKLPTFKELNEDFQIEKISSAETETLIREIRKNMGDKLVNYMRFIESLLNPVNVPMFVFSIVKLLTVEEKNKLSELYKELMKNEISFIKLDLEFSEAEEAKFIKDSFNFWQKAKKDLMKIMKSFDAKVENKSESNNKGYFG